MPRVPTIADFKAQDTLEGLDLTCEGIGCGHHVLMPLDAFKDDDTVLTIGRRAVCSKCGHRGAAVHPRWKPVRGSGVPLG